jgi:4-coumarate--CoA ligase
VNWNELLDAADRAGDTLAYEEVLQSDLCALPFSSGTTGMSKGVMLTHRNLVANLCSSLFSVGPEMVGQVATLGLIPFFHIYGITGICCATLRNKGKVVVMGRFELRTFLNALITQEVSFAPIVPPIILALVKNPIVEEFDLSKLKLKAIMTAAAPLAPELLTAFENKFPGVQVQEVSLILPRCCELVIIVEWFISKNVLPVIHSYYLIKNSKKKIMFKFATKPVFRKAYGLTEHSCITLTHGDPSKGHGIAKKNSVGFLLPHLEIKLIDPETGRSLVKFV